MNENCFEIDRATEHKMLQQCNPAQLIHTSCEPKDTVIRVLDYLPGCGKTSEVLERITRSMLNTEKQWMYITPLISEVKRVSSELGFAMADDDSSEKTREILEQWANGENVVATHSLFRQIHHISKTDNMPYTTARTTALVIDEAIEPCLRIPIPKIDIEHLIANNTLRLDNADNRLYWNRDTKNDNFDEYSNNYKLLFNLLVTNDEELYLHGHTVIWLLNVDAFRAFDEIYILTFNFKNSLMHKYLAAKGFKIKGIRPRLQKTNEDVMAEMRESIYFADTSDIEELGHTFTFNSWKTVISKYDNLKKLKETLNKTLANVCVDNVLFTSPKDYALNVIPYDLNRLSDEIKKKYPDTLKYVWLASKTKGTNEYSFKNSVVYLYDKHYDPVIISFLWSKYGIPTSKADSDNYAVTELIQFVFRSAIRNGEPITLYLPSKRMRNLLKQYLSLPVEEDYKSHNNSKLTEEQKKELMADYKKGAKKTELATKYGLSRMQVHRIIKANK